MKDNIFNFSIDQRTDTLLSMCNKFGGIGLRSINTIIASANIAAAYKVTKKVWNDMDIKILFFTNNIIRDKYMKMIIHYNKSVQNKNKIIIDNIYDDLDIINQKSISLMDNYNQIISDYMIKDCINNLQILCIESGVKYLDDNIQKQDDEMLDERIEQMNYVDETINNQNEKLSQKSLVYNIENNIFHELLEKADNKDKIRILALKSQNMQLDANTYWNGLCKSIFNANEI